MTDLLVEQLGCDPTCCDCGESHCTGHTCEGDSSDALREAEAGIIRCPEPASGVYCEHGIRTTRFCPLCDTQEIVVKEDSDEG